MSMFGRVTGRRDLWLASDPLNDSCRDDADVGVGAWSNPPWYDPSRQIGALKDGVLMEHEGWRCHRSMTAIAVIASAIGIATTGIGSKISSNNGIRR